MSKRQSRATSQRNGKGVETNKEQPTRCIECINPTSTLTRGKYYQVEPMRTAHRGGYYGWIEYVKNAVNARNVSRLRLTNDRGDIILVSPSRFDTSNLKY